MLIMSYSCEISFKKMDAVDIIPFLSELKQNIGKHMEDVAKDNYPFCPYIRRTLSVPEDFENVPHQQIQEAKNWAFNLFKYRYFYDTENQLLGVYGVPDSVKEMFDGSVYFQNSCDQDYDKEHYDGISLFEEIYDKWMNMPNSEFYKMYKKEYDDDFFEAYITEQSRNEMSDYYRKCFAYDEIWKKYENTLFDDDAAIYFSLYGYYDSIRLYSFLKLCHKCYVESMREFEQYKSKSEKSEEQGEER